MGVQCEACDARVASDASEACDTRLAMRGRGVRRDARHAMRG